MSRQDGLSAAGARTATGILLMLAVSVVMPISDAITKYLAGHLPVLQVVWARYFFHFVVLIGIVLWRYGGSALLPRHPIVQLLRGGVLVASSFMFVSALRFVPLADAMALAFVAPLVVTALSPFVLDEPVGWRRSLAVVVGFIGAMIIIRPGFASAPWQSFLALFAGVGYGIYLLVTRKLAGSAPPLVTLAFTAVLGAAVLSMAMPFVWVPPTPLELALMMSVGLLAALGHFLIIVALDYIAASVAAPFTYANLLTAALVGFLIFGDVPDAWTWAGAAVVIASGIYISVRERRLAMDDRSITS